MRQFLAGQLADGVADAAFGFNAYFSSVGRAGGGACVLLYFTEMTAI
jgi:hypothetical protein